MESLTKGFPNLHKNSGLIRGKEQSYCNNTLNIVKYNISL